MAKLICGLAAMAAVLTGAAFLSGAGVSYLEWYSMPATISKAVVTVATLAAFVKVFLFLISLFSPIRTVVKKVNLSFRIKSK